MLEDGPQTQQTDTLACASENRSVVMEKGPKANPVVEGEVRVTRRSHSLKGEGIPPFSHVILDSKLPGISPDLLRDFVIVLESLRNRQLRTSCKWSQIKHMCEDYLETVTHLRCSLLNAQLNSGGGSVDSEADSASEPTGFDGNGNDDFDFHQSNDSVVEDRFADKTHIFRRFLNSDDAGGGTYVNLSDIHCPQIPLEKLFYTEDVSSHKKRHRKHRNHEKSPGKLVLKKFRHGERELAKRKRKKRRKSKKGKGHSKKHRLSHGKATKEYAKNKKKKHRTKKKEGNSGFISGDYCSDFSSGELMRLVNEHSHSYTKVPAAASKHPHSSALVPVGSPSSSDGDEPQRKKRKVSFGKKRDRNEKCRSSKHKHVKSKSSSKRKKTIVVESCKSGLKGVNRLAGGLEAEVNDYSHFVQFSSVKKMEAVQIRQKSVALNLSKVSAEKQRVASHPAQQFVQHNFEGCTPDEIVKMQLQLMSAQQQQHPAATAVISSTASSTGNQLVKYVCSKTTSRLLSVAQAANCVASSDSETSRSPVPIFTTRPSASPALLPHHQPQNLSTNVRHFVIESNSYPYKAIAAAAASKSIPVTLSGEVQNPQVTTFTLPLPAGKQVVSSKFVIPLPAYSQQMGPASPTTSMSLLPSTSAMALDTPAYASGSQQHSNVIIVKNGNSTQIIHAPIHQPVGTTSRSFATGPKLVPVARNRVANPARTVPRIIRQAAKKLTQPVVKRTIVGPKLATVSPQTLPGAIPLADAPAPMQPIIKQTPESLLVQRAIEEAKRAIAESAPDKPATQKASKSKRDRDSSKRDVASHSMYGSSLLKKVEIHSPVTSAINLVKSAQSIDAKPSESIDVKHSEPDALKIISADIDPSDSLIKLNWDPVVSLVDVIRASDYDPSKCLGSSSGATRSEELVTCRSPKDTVKTDADDTFKNGGVGSNIADSNDATAFEATDFVMLKTSDAEVVKSSDKTVSKPSDANVSVDTSKTRKYTAENNDGASIDIDMTESKEADITVYEDDKESDGMKTYGTDVVMGDTNSLLASNDEEEESAIISVVKDITEPHKTYALTDSSEPSEQDASPAMDVPPEFPTPELLDARSDEVPRPENEASPVVAKEDDESVTVPVAKSPSPSVSETAPVEATVERKEDKGPLSPGSVSDNDKEVPDKDSVPNCEVPCSVGPTQDRTRTKGLLAMAEDASETDVKADKVSEASKVDSVSSATEVPTRSFTSISDAVRFSLMDMDDATDSVENQVLQAFQVSQDSSPRSPAYDNNSTNEGEASAASPSAVILTTPQDTTTTTELSVSQRFEGGVHVGQGEGSKFECQGSRTSSWILEESSINDNSQHMGMPKSPEVDSSEEGKGDEKPKKKRKRKDRCDRDLEATHKFWCDICHKGFFSAYNLRRHCRNVHKMEFEKGSAELPFAPKTAPADLPYAGSSSQCHQPQQQSESSSSEVSPRLPYVQQQSCVSPKGAEFMLASPGLDAGGKAAQEFSMKAGQQQQPHSTSSQHSPQVQAPPEFQMQTPPRVSTQMQASSLVSPSSTPKEFRSPTSTTASPQLSPHKMSSMSKSNTTSPKFQRLPTSCGATSSTSSQLTKMSQVSQISLCGQQQPALQQQQRQQMVQQMQQSSALIQGMQQQQAGACQTPQQQLQQQQQQVAQCPHFQASKQMVQQRIGQLQLMHHSGQMAQVQHAQGPLGVQKQAQQYKKCGTGQQAAKLTETEQQLQQAAQLAQTQQLLTNQHLQKLMHIRQNAIVASATANPLALGAAVQGIQGSPPKSSSAQQVFQSQLAAARQAAAVAAAAQLPSSSSTSAQRGAASFGLASHEHQFQFGPAAVQPGQDPSGCPHAAFAQSVVEFGAAPPAYPTLRLSADASDGLEDLEQFLFENMPWSSGGGEALGGGGHQVRPASADSLSLTLSSQAAQSRAAQLKSKTSISRPKPRKPVTTPCPKNSLGSLGRGVKKKSCSKKSAKNPANDAKADLFSQSVLISQQAHAIDMMQAQCGVADLFPAAKMTSKSMGLVAETDSSDSVQCINIQQPAHISKSSVSVGINFNTFTAQAEKQQPLGAAALYGVGPAAFGRQQQQQPGEGSFLDQCNLAGKDCSNLGKSSTTCDTLHAGSPFITPEKNHPPCNSSPSAFCRSERSETAGVFLGQRTGSRRSGSAFDVPGGSSQAGVTFSQETATATSAYGDSNKSASQHHHHLPVLVGSSRGSTTASPGDLFLGGRTASKNGAVSDKTNVASSDDPGCTTTCGGVARDSTGVCDNGGSWPEPQPPSGVSATPACSSSEMKAERAVANTDLDEAPNRPSPDQTDDPASPLACPGTKGKDINFNNVSGEEEDDTPDGTLTPEKSGLGVDPRPFSPELFCGYEVMPSSEERLGNPTWDSALQINGIGKHVAAPLLSAGWKGESDRVVNAAISPGDSPSVKTAATPLDDFLDASQPPGDRNLSSQTDAPVDGTLGGDVDAKVPPTEEPPIQQQQQQNDFDPGPVPPGVFGTTPPQKNSHKKKSHKKKTPGTDSVGKGKKSLLKLDINSNVQKTAEGVNGHPLDSSDVAHQENVCVVVPKRRAEATPGRLRLRDTPKTSVKRLCPCCVDSRVPKKCRGVDAGAVKLFLPPKVQNGTAPRGGRATLKTRGNNPPCVPAKVNTRSSQRLRSRNIVLS